MFGPIGREILSAGTIIFAICATVRSRFIVRELGVDSCQ